MDDILKDSAREILSSIDIPAEQKADVWDLYHDAPDSKRLADALQQLPLPDQIKQQLYDAKHVSDAPPLPEYLIPVIKALSRLSQIDAKVLALGERHPKILAALISAALREQ